MGYSAWANNPNNFPPLPLVAGSGPLDVLVQPADLDTLSIGYANFASSFIANSSASKKPWLLYLAFQHVHTPDFASPKFCGTSKRGLFGDVVEELDWVVGRVLAAVESVQQTQDTIVFFTSDNGPWTNHQLAGGSAGACAAVCVPLSLSRARGMGNY